MKKVPAYGFTLVEMSLVLVIVSLLLGGILKGRELIFDSKVQRCQGEFKTLASVFDTYTNRYKALAGDDPRASRWTGVSAGNGNGVVDGEWTSTTVADETRLVWQHLRAANLITGKDTDAATHAFGGNIGIDNSLMSMSGTMICLQNIPANAAEIIDLSLDDGQRNAGSLRADTNPLLTTKPTASTYTVGNLYTVCYQI